MRVHTYRADTAEAVTHPEVEAKTTLAELVVTSVDERVYRVGDEAELDVELTVGELFGNQPGHVLVHHCRRVTVTVSYTGTATKIEVHPSAHIKKVRKEAIEALGLDPKTSTDLVLRLAGSEAELPANSPIGSFVTKGGCELQLDLVHLVRPQG